MHIAFDLDDTITRCPKFFAAISKALVASGHKVYVITYREDREFAEEDLSQLGIVFNDLILPSEQELHRDYRQWKDHAALWKAETCRRLQIHVLFDDMPEVINALDAQTLGFMIVNPSLGKVAYLKDPIQP